MGIANLFDSIAAHYDTLNHVFSFNIDRCWRRRALRGHISAETQHVLDVACGTADFAIESVHNNAQHVTGIDISNGMLQAGRNKVQKVGLTKQITLIQADCTALPFTNDTFDAVTVAFGVRNFEERAKSLREMYRVLKSGAEVIVMEFSTPRHFPMKQLYRLYFKHIMPWIGGWWSGNKAAWQYLPQSVYNFPQGEAFLRELANAGFVQLHSRRMTCGIATVYYGHKKSEIGISQYQPPENTQHC